MVQAIWMPLHLMLGCLPLEGDCLDPVGDVARASTMKVLKLLPSCFQLCREVLDGIPHGRSVPGLPHGGNELFPIGPEVEEFEGVVVFLAGVC